MGADVPDGDSANEVMAQSGGERAAAKPEILATNEAEENAPSEGGATLKQASPVDDPAIIGVKTYQELRDAIDGKAGTIQVRLDDSITDEGQPAIRVHGVVTIYGNGHGIALSKPTNPLFQIENGGILNLGASGYQESLDLEGTRKQSQRASAYTIIQVTGMAGMAPSTLNMYDGVTIHDAYSTYSGVIQVQGNSIFNMHGGTIKDCFDDGLAGGICVTNSRANNHEIRPIFNMYGGRIKDCGTLKPVGDGLGGGIFLDDGIANLSGGEITGCTANYGGAICCQSGTINLSGAKLVGNKATYGGAICIFQQEEEPQGRLALSGGSVTDNQATAFGGAVYAEDGVSITSDGSGKQRVTICDNQAMIGGGVCLNHVPGVADLSHVVLANNYASYCASDVYLSSSSTMVLPDAKGMDQIYEACGLTDTSLAGKKIDGWYDDHGERYTPSKTGTPISSGGNVEGGLCLVASYKIKPALVVTLDGEETSATYDGKSHAPSFSIAGCTVDGEEKDASGIVNGAKFLPKDAVATSGPEGRRAFTDAGTYMVDDGQYVTISAADLVSLLGDHADDYDVSFIVRKPAKVAIAKRKVVITTGSASKRQDGTELSSGDYHIGGDGFVDGGFDPKGAIRTTGSQTAPGSSDNTFEVVYTGGEGLPEDYLDNYEIEPHLGKLEVVSADEPDPTPAAPDGPRGDQKPSDAAPSTPSDQAGSDDVGALSAKQGAYVPKHMKAAPSATAALPQTGDPTAESGPRFLAAALAGAFLTALGTLGLRRRDS